MRNVGIAIITVLILFLAAPGSFADEKLPTLKAVGVTYSNVVVFKVSATDIYFTSNKGLANVKLKDLDSAMQKHFNFNPTNAAAVESDRVEADAQYRRALTKDGMSSRPEGGRPTTLAAKPGVDVFLIPLDDFEAELAAALANSLSQELGIRIAVTGRLTFKGLAPFAGTTQYSGDDILAAAEDGVQRLPGSLTNTAYIVLTQRDINMNDRKLRFNFAIHHYDTRTSLVSSARMSGPRNGKAANLEIITARFKKMVKRSIGLVYYHYPHSSDIYDLMFAPIMSLDDVDRIGDDFSNRPHGA
jgi:predicted Zn-dependent protease